MEILNPIYLMSFNIFLTDDQNQDNRGSKSAFIACLGCSYAPNKHNLIILLVLIAINKHINNCSFTLVYWEASDLSSYIHHTTSRVFNSMRQLCG